jgi:hypothetical protein
MQVDPLYGIRRRMRLVRVLRWVLVAASLALATVLLLRRDYVVGFLIAGLVVVRVAILVGTAGRGRPYRRGSRVSAQQAGMPATPGVASPTAQSGGRPLAGLARSEFLVAAGVIGMAPAQMSLAYNRGSSLAEMAAGNGVPLERVLNAIVGDAGSKIDDAVARGTMNPRRAVRFKSRLPVWGERLVNHHKHDLQPTR